MPPPRRPPRAPGAPAPLRRGPIVVIGSVNMDLVCRVDRLPGPGETVLGGDLAVIPGGKGANQAVAAARLGGDVHLVARVGDDDFGRTLLRGLRENGVRTARVAPTRRCPSGCALILVDRRGENCITVAPGANGRLTPRDIDRAAGLIARASVVVLQLEVPFPAVARAIRLARRLGAFTILDPAPAPPGGLPPALRAVDLLTPNESEASALLGRRAGDLPDPEEAGRSLLALGAGSAVLKLGARGALACFPGGELAAPGFRVKVVDSTAAGDAFTGALAAALSRGLPLREALDLANGAGARCCESFGAQPALPRLADVERLLRRARRPASLPSRRARLRMTGGAAEEHGEHRAGWRTDAIGRWSRAGAREGLRG